MSRAPTILGVTYDLEGMRLLIKQKRKEEILDEIEGGIMSSCRHTTSRSSGEAPRQTYVRGIPTMGKGRKSLPQSLIRKAVLQLLFGKGQLSHQQIAE